MICLLADNLPDECPEEITKQQQAFSPLFYFIVAYTVLLCSFLFFHLFRKDSELRLPKSSVMLFDPGAEHLLISAEEKEQGR